MAASFSVSKLFPEGTLTKQGGDLSTASLDGKVVALYFSAHWCPPCRAFTPTLIAAYNDAIKAGLNFELIFISSDQDDEGFNAYFADMPWAAVKFDAEEVRGAIGESFGVSGIPALHVLKPNGDLLTKEGKAQVAKSKVDAIAEWTKA